MIPCATAFSKVESLPEFVMLPIHSHDAKGLSFLTRTGFDRISNFTQVQHETIEFVRRLLRTIEAFILYALLTMLDTD